MIHRSYIIQGVEIRLSSDSRLLALLSEYFASLHADVPLLPVKPVQYCLHVVKESPLLPSDAVKAITTPAVTAFSNSRKIYLLSRRGSLICLDPAALKANVFFREEAHHDPTDVFPLLGASLVEILRYSGYFFLHAAAIKVDNVSYLICGDGGTGKTTATLSLVREGFQYVGDDSLFLRDDNGIITISPLYTHVHVDGNLANRFPEITKGKNPKIPNGRKVPVNISAHYPDAFLPSLNPNVIVFPAITSDRMSKIIPITQTDIFKRLLKQTALPVEKHIAREQLKILQTLVSQTKGFALHSGRDVYDDSSLLVSLLKKMEG